MSNLKDRQTTRKRHDRLRDADGATRKALAAYTGPIKRYPPGNAYGADDLRTWAMRRATGKSGVPDKVNKWRQWLRQRRRRERHGAASKADLEYALYLGRKSTGITVCPDPYWPGMWRVHRDGRISDMVNLSRAKDAARTMANAGGCEVLHWRCRRRPAEAAPMRCFDQAAE
jgi:hypothetical protein